MFCLPFCWINCDICAYDYVDMATFIAVFIAKIVHIEVILACNKGKYLQLHPNSRLSLLSHFYDMSFVKIGIFRIAMSTPLKFVRKCCSVLDGLKQQNVNALRHHWRKNLCTFIPCTKLSARILGFCKTMSHQTKDASFV